MLPPYKRPSNRSKRKQKTSSDIKRPQMTSRESNPTVDSVTETVADSASHAHSANKHNKIENELKRGGNIEIDYEHLDETLHNNKYL